MPYVAEDLRPFTDGSLLSAADERRLAADVARGRVAAQRVATGTTEAERAALREAARAAQEARARLVLANVRLVVAIARPYAGRGVPLTDLVQEGTIGLMVAVDRFDGARGSRFASYASPWIRRHVADALASRRVVRLPPKAERDMVLCRRTYDAIERERGAAPTPAELAQRAGLEVALVERLMAADAPTVPLDSLHSLTLDPELVEGPLRDVRAEERVRLALAHLDPDERDVMDRRFGLDDGSPRSARAVADELGRPQSWVRAVERRALRRLRNHPAVSGLQETARPSLPAAPSAPLTAGGR